MTVVPGVTRKFNPFLGRADWPILVLILVGLGIGLFTLRDYGQTWDEPVFYKYASQAITAYLPENWSNASYDPTLAFGPDNMRYYGPAYLMAHKVALNILRLLPFHWLDIDRHHLINLVFFLIGITFLYALCKRWMGRWAALAGTAFFASQPLIWGHAFFNPKDTPFMIAFIISVYLGLWMVDRISGPKREIPAADKPVRFKEQFRQDWHVLRRRALIGWGAAGLVLLVVFLGLILAGPWLREAISGLVQSAYLGSGNGLVVWLFRAIARNYHLVQVTSYQAKALVWFVRGQALMGLLTAICLLVELTKWFPGSTRRIWKAFFSPQIAPAFLAGACLGLCTSVRFLGPLAGGMVLVYFLLKPGRKPLLSVAIYAGVALVTCYLSWPYLWDSPVGKYLDIIRIMARIPYDRPVLFNGSNYSTTALPWDYFPVLVGLTFTEPTWPLFLAGVVIAVLKVIKGWDGWRSLSGILGWFLLPVIYILVGHPTMYDNFRHFLFIFPAAFVFIGLAIQGWLDWVKKPWLKTIPLLLIFIPGILGVVKLHPYEYAYYNMFAGGTGGAVGRFETDYWLSSYREAVLWVNSNLPDDNKLTFGEFPDLADPYLKPGTDLEIYMPQAVRPGDILILPTRFDEASLYFPDAKILYTVSRDGAVFAVVKQVGGP